MSKTPVQTETVESTKASPRASGFWAIVRYELLWNIRKKKVLAMVIIALVITIIPIALTPVLSSAAGQKITANPDAVATSGGINSFIMFLLALVTVMNSISGEFESGTIIPLLTKPVSRTTIFLAKVAGAILTLSPVYVLIYIITIVGGILVYGPQQNLYVVPLLFVGSIVSTFIWMSIVLALSSVTKSSLFAAILPFLIFIVLYVSEPIISIFLGQTQILLFLPGSGNTGYLVSSVASASSSVALGSTPIQTGTDGIANTLVNFVLHPSYLVAFVRLVGITSVSGSSPSLPVTSTEPLSLVLLTALGVAFAYIFVFLFIGWFAFRWAQISE